MNIFYCYRIMVSEPPQYSLFEKKTKEELFRELFALLEAGKRDEFEHYGKKIVYHFSKPTDNIFIWNIAKEQIFDKPVAGDDRIENVPDVRYPNIYLIFHVIKQLVFIEYKSSVFPDVDTVKNTLEFYFGNKLAKYKLDVHLFAITDEKELWDEVATMDVVQEVDFDYNPPNFFRGAEEVDRLVSEVYAETRFEKFKIMLQNKLGLTFTREAFGAYVNRLASGAGQYTIKGIRNGIEFVIKSVTNPFRREIDPQNSSPDEIEEAFNDAEKLNRP